MKKKEGFLEEKRRISRRKTTNLSSFLDAKNETAIAIKGKNIHTNTSLLKAYATSKKAARRIVYLLRSSSGRFILLFYRDKKDKTGENITIKNTFFANALKKHLEIVFKDISENNFIILE